MTGMEERVAKVAEVLAGIRATGEKLVPEHGCGGDLDRCLSTCPVPYAEVMPPEEIAQALAPLLGEWQAEDEARAGVVARVEAVLAECDRRINRSPDRVLKFWIRRLRAALAEENHG